MFDFVKVSLAPEPDAEPLAAGVDSVVYKLGQILEIHRPLFRELAHFLACGHRVSLIEGNHDAEIYFEAVRARLREELSRLAAPFQAAHPDRVVATAVADRLSFRGWFEAAQGKFHIEHGHQYDPYCAFEYPLAPYDAPQKDLLATPLSHLPMPHFAELLGDFSTHNIQKWTWRQVVALMRQLGPRALSQMARIYLTVVPKLVLSAGRQRRARRQQLAPLHEARLRALSQDSAYGFVTLQGLDALKATPAEYSRLRMAHVFFLDRLFGLILLGAVLAAMTGLGNGLLARATVAAFGGVALWGLGRLGKSDLNLLLRAAAARIASLTGARYVVFGHSHAPELVQLSAGAFYINSGSWVTREILRGEEGVGMSYVEIGASRVALLRWRGEGEPPALLASTEEPTRGL